MVFGQVGYCFVVFGVIFFGEGVYGGFGDGVGIGLLDFVQVSFYCWLYGFWEFVQYVGDFVNLIFLMMCVWEDFVECFLEFYCFIVDCDFWWYGEVVSFDVD